MAKEIKMTEEEYDKIMNFALSVRDILLEFKECTDLMPEEEELLDKSKDVMTSINGISNRNSHTKATIRTFVGYTHDIEIAETIADSLDRAVTDTELAKEIEEFSGKLQRITKRLVEERQLVMSSMNRKLEE